MIERLNPTIEDALQDAYRIAEDERVREGRRFLGDRFDDLFIKMLAAYCVDVVERGIVDVYQGRAYLTGVWKFEKDGVQVDPTRGLATVPEAA